MILNASMDIECTDDLAQYVYHFDSDASCDKNALGTKGYNLVKMTQAGLPVPEGFCISTQIYWHFLKTSGLIERINAILEKGSENANVEIGSLIKRTPVAEDIVQCIAKALPKLAGEYFAIRSSGIDEDSAEFSFAGQHDTYLYVHKLDQIVNRIRDCWASIWNSRADTYRQRTSNHLQSLAMGVVVQRMVSGSVSGVAFGHLPTSADKSKFLIEACYGLCEGLVSGRVVSDSYIVDKESGVPEQIDVRYKLTALKYRDDSLREVTISENQREVACLSITEIQSFLDILDRTETYFSSPQDVEWTLADGSFYLLQSRPITTQNVAVTEQEKFYLGNKATAVEENILWSRMDIGEIFTGRMTPLGISFAKHYQFKVHSDCGIKLGLLDLGEPGEYMAYHKGHVYLNVSYAAYLLAQTPVGKDQYPFLARFTSEEVDLKDYVNPYGQKHSHASFTSGKCTRNWISKNFKELLSAKKRAKRMVASRYKEYDRALKLDLSTFDKTRLREETDHCLSYFRAMHMGYLPYYINAFGFYELLSELCSSWLGEKGKHIQNRLKGDMSNLRTIESANDVWKLCQQLDHYPILKQDFQKYDPTQIEKIIHDTEQGKQFLHHALEPFMRENGVRAQEEMELSHNRWVDDPSYVLQMIKIYLQNGYSVDRRLVKSDGERDKQSQLILSDLPLHKRFVLKKVIDLYAGCSRLREDTRMSMITSIWLIRRIVNEVGRRLISLGVLRSNDEIKYLDFTDILTYIYDDKLAQTIFDREKIITSKAIYQQYKKQNEPPLTFIGYPHDNNRFVESENSESLLGLGTSRGQITASARVIHDLNKQASELQKGEIIITQFTDASWTPLFAIAGGW